MASHIYMTIIFKGNALIFKERALPFPTRSSTSHLVHNTMARKKRCSWCISEGTTYHTRMTRPSCQSGNKTVCGYITPWNLTHNAEHGIPEHSCLLSRHLIRIIFHLIRMVRVYLVQGQFLLVDSTPSIDDVGQNEGDEQTDVEHGAQGELAAAGVLHGEGRLQVGR